MVLANHPDCGSRVHTQSRLFQELTEHTDPVVPEPRRRERFRVGGQQAEQVNIDLRDAELRSGVPDVHDVKHREVGEKSVRYFATAGISNNPEDSCPAKSFQRVQDIILTGVLFRKVELCKQFLWVILDADPFVCVHGHLPARILHRF